MKDLASTIDIRRALSPVSVSDNTAQVGQVIDTWGYRSLVFGISVGSLADSDATFTALLEESDAAGFGGAAAVSDVDLVGTEAEAGFQFDDDNATRKIGYIGSKRYVRLTITPSNNASAALISAVAILGHPFVLPVA